MKKNVIYIITLLTFTPTFINAYEYKEEQVVNVRTEICNELHLRTIEHQIVEVQLMITDVFPRIKNEHQNDAYTILNKINNVISNFYSYLKDWRLELLFKWYNEERMSIEVWQSIVNSPYEIEDSFKWIDNQITLANDDFILPQQ